MIEKIQALAKANGAQSSRHGRRQQTAVNGEIVVALLGEEATVKRYSKRGDKIWLLPENDAYSPIDGTEAQLYPAWEYRKMSPLRSTMVRAFRKVYGRELGPVGDGVVLLAAVEGDEAGIGEGGQAVGQEEVGVGLRP